MRTYRYIGPKRIADQATSTPAGTPVRSAADVVRWVRESGQRPGPDGCVIATFVVNAAEVLLVADRHSEHVACAGRQPVRSAGEITFRMASRSVEVVAVSNQSTGYCPEPESWAAVVAALSAAGLEPTAGFELACVFRRCPRCGSINVVKGGVFECGACGAELPAAYNCQVAEAEPGAAADGGRDPGSL
jgi:hypothetical protein